MSDRAYGSYLCTSAVVLVSFCAHDNNTTSDPVIFTPQKKGIIKISFEFCDKGVFKGHMSFKLSGALQNNFFNNFIIQNILIKSKMRVVVLVLVTIRLAVAELEAEQVEATASGKFGILRPPLLGVGGFNPVQTCIGAFCQQNNQNQGGEQEDGGFGGGGNPFQPRPPFTGGGGFNPSQTCLGGQCQQNNDNLSQGSSIGGRSAYDSLAKLYNHGKGHYSGPLLVEIAY